MLGWVSAISTPPPQPQEVKLAPPGYGQVCHTSDQDCTDDLECVNYNTTQPEFGVCKVKLGQLCTSVTQCGTNGRYCTGVCSETPYGGLNQTGPCQEGLIENSEGMCKLPVGDPCQTSETCVTDLCYNGYCIFPLGSGDSCQSEVECATGNCSQGYCQVPGIETGQEGAVCSTNARVAPGCDQDLGCFAMWNEEHHQGVCVPLTQELNHCGGSASCPPPMVCQYTQDNYGNNTTSCVFPYLDDQPDPTNCSVEDTSLGPLTTGVCNPGSSCQEGRCIMDTSFDTAIYRWKNWIPSTLITQLNAQVTDAVASEDSSISTLEAAPRVMTGEWEYITDLKLHPEPNTLSVLETDQGPPYIIFRCQEWYVQRGETPPVAINLNGKARYKKEDKSKNLKEVAVIHQARVTPAACVVITLNFLGSVSGTTDVYRQCVAELSKNFEIDGIVTIDTYVANYYDSTPYTYRWKEVGDDTKHDLETFDGPSFCEDRLNDLGQIKASFINDGYVYAVVTTIEQLGFYIEDIEKDNAEPVFVRYDTPDCRWVFNYIYDWTQYLKYEFIFQTQKAIIISQEAWTEESDGDLKIVQQYSDLVIPPPYLSGWSDMSAQLSGYYPYAQDYDQLLLSFFLRYQQTWRLVVMYAYYSVIVPVEDLTETSVTTVSFPSENNYTAFAYLVK